MQNNDKDCPQLSESMKNIAVPEVDRSAVVDCSDIKIDMTKPKREKVISYILQTKNPYFFKCDGTVVKNTYPKTAITFADTVKQIISNE